MLISADLVFRPDGSIQSTICTYYDITELKRTEDALQRALAESEQTRVFLEAVVSAQVDAVIIYDSNMKVQRVNPAFIEVYGFNPNGLHVTEIMQRVSCRSLDGLPVSLEAQPTPLALDGQKVTGFRFAVTRADSSEGAVEVSSGPIKLENRIIGAVTVWHDITKRKMAEETLKERTQQLEDTNKELESFSYSVSHDLRAPLRAIEGYSRIILRKHTEKLDKDALEKFNVIMDNTRMMSQLIEDLLVFSRMGKAQLSIANLGMKDLIGEIWKELASASPDRRMTLKIAEFPPCMGDRGLIKQVLVNLISNAIKFTRTREEALIEVGGEVKGSECLYYIRDNGVGFDMKYYDKMFGVFQRLHRDSEFEGTGVGLAIAQRIINRHGGKIWAEGEADKGATFYFTLPTLQE